MHRWIAVVTFFCLLVAAPASAAPGFTAPLDVDGSTSNAVMAPDGTVYVAVSPYIDSNFRTGVQIRPPGGPFGELKLLDSPGAHGAPSIARGGDGRVVAAWVEGGDVQVATLMPGAADFGAPVPITDQNATTAAVGVDGAGNTTVLWGSWDPTNGMVGTIYLQVHATTFPANGGAPTTQLLEQLGPTANTYYQAPPVQLRVNAAGDAIASWETSQTDSPITTYTDHLRAAIRPAGQPFGAYVAVEDAIRHSAFQPTDTSFQGPAISINDAGDLGIAWLKSYGNAPLDIFFRAGTASGGLSGSNEDVDSHTTNTNETVPSMVIDSDGRAIVVTRALSNSFRRVEAVFRPKGGTFGDSQRVQNLDEEASWDALAAGPNGAVLLAWGTYAAATNYSLFGAAAGSGTSFGSPKPIQSNIDSLSSPFAALGASGDGLIGWSFINGPLYDGQIAGYDATGPQLRDLAVPASGTVGTPLAFSVQASDIWGPIASTSWAFGDGAGADGTSVSHAFDSAGDRTVTVTATDAVGNASSASAPVSVSAPAPAPPLVCCAPPPDKTPPLVSAFAASPVVFAVGPKATPLVAKVARGTKFRFRSSEAGSLTITIARQLAGKRSGKRCLPPSKKLRKKKSCKRYKRVGTLKRAVVNGQNSIAFSGRLGTRALSIGRYRATLVATDAAGNKARAVDATFRIVKFR